jgi:hypothetical protein
VNTGIGYRYPSRRRYVRVRAFEYRSLILEDRGHLKAPPYHEWVKSLHGSMTRCDASTHLLVDRVPDLLGVLTVVLWKSVE